MSIYFSSRDTAYRNPFGAVKDGTAIHFRIRIPREWGCRAAHLCMESDDCSTNIGMFWAGEENDFEWWECHFAPTSAVYFYHFALSCDDGERWLTANPDGTANESRHPANRWQLTCYEKDFKTPDWLKGGVMYQIFPDRFCKADGPKENVPTDRVLRENWGEMPHWKPNEHGKVLNNDYFGGDLQGIIAKLPYLQSLGVTCLYINPIFEAHSNHRYDTADYEKIDVLLGNENDFKTLCTQAETYGIRIILDGVFSHTGADSRYFNKCGRYDTVGAYQSTESLYYPWYQFSHHPDRYASWWGFETLPELNELSPDFRRFIAGENGICRSWMRKGASGWRLDVADELPDVFIDDLRKAVKAENPDGILLGEVWEDASNKESYGKRRRYLLGKQLDSVMNYPFANAVLQVMTGGNTDDFYNTVEGIVENYPPQVTRLLMNHIGTHDTPRALTTLAGEPAYDRGREWQAAQVLSPADYERGIQLLKCAATIQFCLPGVPCVYYGDEVGMQGHRDPFNRGCFPWGQENAQLLQWYRALGEMRGQVSALKDGEFKAVRMGQDVICFIREDAQSVLLCAVNRQETPVNRKLVGAYTDMACAVGDGVLSNGVLTLPPLSASVFVLEK